MIHKANHPQFGEGFMGSSLDPSCEECYRKDVGDLDDKNFELLAGMTRREFEEMLQEDYNAEEGVGIYNFWYAIMGGDALRCFARKRELMERVAATGSV